MRWIQPESREACRPFAPLRCCDVADCCQRYDGLRSSGAVGRGIGPRAFVLGVIIQGRIVDEHVHPPTNVRAYLVAIEILVATVFFVAAAKGVLGCLFFLDKNRIPEGGDRAVIEQALLTTTVAAFLLMIAKRALPACWPAPGQPPEELQPMRAGVALGVIFGVTSLSAAFWLDVRGLLLYVPIMSLGIVVFMAIWLQAHKHAVEDEGLRARFLGRRRAWTRVPVRPVKGSRLDGAVGLPPAFVPVTQEPGDATLWLSGQGVERLRTLLDEHSGAGAPPVLRWLGRRNSKLVWHRGAR